MDQPRDIDTQRPSGEPAQTGITRSTQTSPKKISQTGGTQTMPPPSPRRSTLTGETQTTPLQNNIQDQRVQGQLDRNHISEDPLANNTGSNTSKGKKNRKKLPHEIPAQPGLSGGGFAVPRTDFISRNLGTGRPTIQCTAYGEYSHWRR